MNTHAQPAAASQEFFAVCDNYLAMLAQPQPTVSPSTLSSPEAAYHPLPAGEYELEADFGAVANVAAVYGDEPLFDMDEYLTSPMPLVPDDDFDTPADTPYSAFMPTPQLAIGGEFDAEAANGEAPIVPADAPAPVIDLEGLLSLPDGEYIDFGAEVEPQLPTSKLAMYTPSTPALDSFDEMPPFPAQPALKAKTGPVIPPPPIPMATRSTRRSVPGATGTRKNITPSQLIPDDAPTQKRMYLTPSSTSRKVVPVSLRKRTRGVAFEDDDEDDSELTAAQLDAIAQKRRQNTLAARKSRKRKLEHTQALEQRVAELESEVTVWRERSGVMREMLLQRGVPIGEFADA